MVLHACDDGWINIGLLRSDDVLWAVFGLGYFNLVSDGLSFNAGPNECLDVVHRERRELWLRWGSLWLWLRRIYPGGWLRWGRLLLF